MHPCLYMQWAYHHHQCNKFSVLTVSTVLITLWYNLNCSDNSVFEARSIRLMNILTSIEQVLVIIICVCVWAGNNTVSGNGRAQEINYSQLWHYHLLPLQMHWDCQTVLYLLCQLPDTADRGRTFAYHGPPFHALIDAGQQVGGLQLDAISQSLLDPCIASWYLARPSVVHALPSSEHVCHQQKRQGFWPQLGFHQ